MPVANPRPTRTPSPRAALHYLRRRRAVGFAPGGGVDIVARLLARSWSATLGQSAQVDNRAGANGSLAMENVVRAGDEHRLLFGTTDSFVINNELFPAWASTRCATSRRSACSSTRSLIVAERARYGALIREAGIKPDGG